MGNGKCILCGREVGTEERFATNEFFFDCPNCGRFSCSLELLEDAAHFLTDYNKPLLSGYIRERTERSKEKGPVIKLDRSNITEMLESPIIPRTVSEKMDKLILFFDRKTHYLMQMVEVHSHNNGSAICYAHNDTELKGLLRALKDDGFIRDSGGMDGCYYLTVKGHDRAEKLKKKVSESDTAFVAMWFHDQMDSAYDNAIKPAIESKECGHFKAFRVDEKEHNNDITDEIIAEIKASRFVVADMTGYRGGVYYEAGYARGLGKEVIITCRKDWFEGEEKDGEWVKERIHFDINHLNIIVWETEEELKERLINRIRATIM